MDPLYVSERGVFLGKHSERLVQRRGKETLSEHPLMDLEQVLVETPAGGISWDLVTACCLRGIPITLLGRGGAPIARVSSPSLVATVKTRREQIAAYLDDRGVAVARAMAKAKLRNQANTLRYFGKYRKTAEPEVYSLLEEAASTIRDLEKQAGDVHGACIDEARTTLLNLEGRAGACYWRGVKALLGEKAPLHKREHRGTADPVNAAFNYGYGILQSQVWSALTLAGLEPFAGFVHVDRPGKPSLVLDLMEEFRQPIVDRALIAAIGHGMKLSVEENEDSLVEETGSGSPRAPGETAPADSEQSAAAEQSLSCGLLDGHSAVAAAQSDPTDLAPGEGSEVSAARPARFLDAESKRCVAAKILERLTDREKYRSSKYGLKNIIQMQARRLAVALREEAEYEGFTVSW